LACEALIRSRRKIRFIQVGANDGVRFDDLYFTVTSCRWAGLVIEPLPNFFERLVTNYQDHREVIPLNIAIHPSETSARIFHVRPESLARYPDYAAGLGSMAKDHLLKHGIVEDDIAESVVICKSLTEVACEHGYERPDVLQIDTEGFDFEVIKSIDFSRLKPLVLKFEWMNLTDTDRQQVSRMLESQGYRLWIEHGAADCVAIQKTLRL